MKLNNEELQILQDIQTMCPLCARIVFCINLGVIAFELCDL